MERAEEAVDGDAVLVAEAAVSDVEELLLCAHVIGVDQIELAVRIHKDPVQRAIVGVQSLIAGKIPIQRLFCRRGTRFRRLDLVNCSVLYELLQNQLDRNQGIIRA